jgi:hypothetical protein
MQSDFVSRKMPPAVLVRGLRKSPRTTDYLDAIVLREGNALAPSQPGIRQPVALGRIAAAIEQAVARLQPAKIGTREGDVFVG